MADIHINNFVHGNLSPLGIMKITQQNVIHTRLVHVICENKVLNIMTDMRKEKRILHNCIIHFMYINDLEFKRKKNCYDALPLYISNVPFGAHNTVVIHKHIWYNENQIK